MPAWLRSIARAVMLAAVPAFVVAPVPVAMFALADVRRQGWLADGFWYLAAHHVVRSVAIGAWVVELLVLGLFATARATSARAMPVAERTVAAFLSWALFFYPLQLVLTPWLRASLMENEQASTLVVTLIAVPQTPVGGAALWALFVYALWKWRAGRGVRSDSRQRRATPWALAPGIVLAAAALAVDAAAPSPPPGTPDIVWILVDTLRADHLGMYGYTGHPTSPHLDAFAKDAVVYEHAVTPAPWTSPSVAAMLTARHPRRLGFHQVPVFLAPGEVTMPELLRARGLRTDAVVSNMFASSAVGYDSGFETMDESEIGGHLYVSSVGVTERAMEVVDRRKGEPFLLWLHYFDPHFAYRMHEEFEFAPAYQGPLRGGLTHAEFTVRLPTMTPAEVEYVIAAYDSEIAYTDAQIGRLLDRLKALGLYDRSLIVFTADHGEEFAERGDHFIGHGRTLQEELLHVPLIVKWPGNANAGTRVAATVSTMDIAPSVVAAAGTAFPPAVVLDGQPLDAAADGRMRIAETRRDVDKRAVYDGNWKLIVDRTSGRTRLFDLASDPGEHRDQAADQPEIARRLLDAVDEWERDLGDRSSTSATFGARDTDRLRAIGYLQ